MSEDAHQQSQAAQDTPRTAELRQFVEELAGRLAAIEAERGRRRRMAEILDSAGGPEPPLVPPRKPKRDRHGMHVVRGCAVLAGAGLAWLVRSRMRRAVAGMATVALVTGGTLSPDLMEHVPAAQVPAGRHHHEVRHHHRDAAVVPPAVPARRKRRRPVRAPHASSGAPPRPSASPSPSQAHPSPWPDPDPSPSVTIPPDPTPAPTCLHLTGHHCHDDGAGDAVRAPGALAGRS